MERVPNIILSLQDLERLEALLDSLPASTAGGKAALMAELRRAEVVEPKDLPPDVVTMNSIVRFAIESTGEEFCLKLVYPGDMDGSPDRISVLAPVGSALLGLSVGDRIDWPRPGGGIINVRIIEIVSQPERVEDRHL